MSVSRNAATISSTVGNSWRIATHWSSMPAIRRPMIGSSGAMPAQNTIRNGPSSTRARSESRRARRSERSPKTNPVRAAS